MALDESVQAYLDVLQEKGDLWIDKEFWRIYYSYHASVGQSREWQLTENKMAERSYLSEEISITISTSDEGTKLNIYAEDGQVRSVAKEGKEGVFILSRKENGEIKVAYATEKIDKSRVEKIFKEGETWYSRAKKDLKINTLEGFKKALSFK